MFSQAEQLLIAEAYPGADAATLLPRLEAAVRAEAADLDRDWRATPPNDGADDDGSWLVKPDEAAFIARAKRNKLAGLANGLVAERMLSPEERAARTAAEARAGLSLADHVAVRCVKAGIPYPEEWRAYDEALRAIVRAPQPDQALPTPPAAPDYAAGRAVP